MQLLVSLLAGILGGNLAGAVFKRTNLGMASNSLAGLAGGAVGGQLVLRTELIHTLGTSPAAIAIATLFASAALGAGVTVVVGLARQVMARH